MTTTTPTPTKTDPQPPQTSAGRSLRMVGVVLAALFVATAAWGAIGTLASAWGGRDATTATATYPARPTVELDADGDVTVSSGGDRVVVERTSRVPFGHVRYSVEDSTDRLLVRHRCPVLVSGSCHADLAVTVPAGTTLVVRSHDGQVSAHDVQGDLTARLGDGSASIAGVRGDVDVTTGDGHLDVRDVVGAVSARSSDGSVLVSGVQGDVSARSSDGRVDVAAVEGDVEATSSDGDVTVRSTGEPVALDISTTDGRQTVQAPTDPSATRTVRIHSSDGDVAFLGPRG
jgi:hypothetical protein